MFAPGGGGGGGLPYETDGDARPLTYGCKWVFRAKHQYFKPPRSCLGFCEETQNYAKRNRSQIFFLSCFVYRITSVIINQRFLQIVENIIIR